MPNIEMHFHTAESECASWRGWEEIGYAIEQSDLNYFCITDHGSLEGYKYLKINFPEIKDKLFPGIEITTPSHGDFLIYSTDVYFLNHLERVYNLEDLIKKTKTNQPLAMIWAHPSRNPFYGTENSLEAVKIIAEHIDGIELYNGHMKQMVDKHKNFADEIEKIKGQKIALIGGSDTHSRGGIKRAYTEFPSLEFPEEMIEFLKKGECVPIFDTKK